MDVALKKVDYKLADKQLNLKLTTAAKDYLVENGFDAKFGARPLLRTIQRQLEDPLAEFILVNRPKPGSHIKVDFDKQTHQLTFSVTNIGKKKTVSI